MSSIDELFPRRKQLDPAIPRALPGMGMDTGFEVDGEQLVEQKVFFAIIRPDGILQEIGDTNGDQNYHRFLSNESDHFIRVRIEMLGQATEQEYDSWIEGLEEVVIKTWSNIKDRVKKREPVQRDLTNLVPVENVQT